MRDVEEFRGRVRSVMRDFVSGMGLLIALATESGTIQQDSVALVIAEEMRGLTETLAGEIEREMSETFIDP